MAKELSIIETEKNILQQVEQWKKDNPNKHVFYLQGEGFTNLMRDFWESDLAHKALHHMGVVNGIPLDVAIKIVTGEMMAIGDSRVEMLVVEDDGRFKDSYNNYTIEQMIARHEKYFINHSNYRAELVRYINLLTNKEIENDDAVVLIDNDDNETEWMSPTETREKIVYLDEKIGKSVQELEFLYPIVNKSLKNLPYNQIGTTTAFFDSNSNRDVKIISKKVLVEIQKRQKTNDDNKKIEQQRLKQDKRDKRDKREQQKLVEELERNKNLITEITEDQFKDISSCWLTNEGKMFGDNAYPFIHDHICFYLSEAGFFGKDKNGENIRKSEKDVEEMNWIKLSGGHGFMLYKHRNPNICINEEQRETILKWCIANDEESVEFNNSHIPLKQFANADLNDLMEFRYMKYTTKYNDDNGEEK
jgi:hypothetical protein